MERQIATNCSLLSITIFAKSTLWMHKYQTRHFYTWNFLSRRFSIHQDNCAYDVLGGNQHASFLENHEYYVKPNRHLTVFDTVVVSVALVYALSLPLLHSL